ncbi:AraC family transcriptional regulator [Amycolatopsis sp. WAC 01376]|uniref:AraC family transcriptional regulator n=2 Tax=unclassified Amycolatopsis TaxID=2618356 RepID=UPI000F778A18|nr:AraC family transcriptional regulator [Amycolatopsis sp. WAC 01376]
MDKFSEQVVVERVIVSMQENLGERLTVDDMARSAMFSKFHFTRVFQRVTGVSPARFLSAMRIQEAKRLLVSTAFTVADISYQVGYNSPGTFSSRFKESVGVSPIAYRQLRGYAPVPAQRRGSELESRSSTLRGDMQVCGEGERGLTFVGLFRDPIPQGNPVSCSVLSEPGDFVLENVPEGTWYLLAQSVAPGAEETVTGSIGPDGAPFVGSRGPLVVHQDVPVIDVDLDLRPARAMDPPVLLALLDVRTAALQERAS